MIAPFRYRDVRPGDLLVHSFETENPKGEPFTMHIQLLAVDVRRAPASAKVWITWLSPSTGRTMEPPRDGTPGDTPVSGWTLASRGGNDS